MVRNEVANGRLEILSDTRVPLVREDAGILNPRVSPSRYVSDYRLRLGAIGIIGGIWTILVVVLVVIVLLWLTRGHARVLARVVRVVGCRIG